MKDSFRVLYLIVFFDLPVQTEDEKKEYTKFRRRLIKSGYIMIQYSVYGRFCANDSDYQKHKNRLIKEKPKYGDVRLLKITNNQYNDILVITGKKKDTEIFNMEDEVLVI